jgi:hypothetical protein
MAWEQEINTQGNNPRRDEGLRSDLPLYHNKNPGKAKRHGLHFAVSNFNLNNGPYLIYPMDAMVPGPNLIKS